MSEPLFVRPEWPQHARRAPLTLRLFWALGGGDPGFQFSPEEMALLTDAAARRRAYQGLSPSQAMALLQAALEARDPRLRSLAGQRRRRGGRA